MAKQRQNAEIKADEPTIGLEPEGTEPLTTSLPDQQLERIGGTIGPYKLLDELGEGGMGTVYLAEQDRPVRRRVALKIIKPGLDTAHIIARFEAERQALALMDHAHIARVLDAGTTGSGRPYFVMELVQGAPITTYCDERRLPVQKRLELFLPVCRAVQHAHQKGIIHRDLKPSNILVTIRDDVPAPKIIDFGIAKATTQRLTERTLYTQHGQLVGTPDYMSPEQAGHGGLDVDTRSDVYSLGAVLYELLCGETPFGHQRLKQLDFMAMLATIYEDEPAAPSRRVTELGDRADDTAQRRDTDHQRLVQHLRGELDWIVAKALEKERTRRYESASALAADIERHLNHQPVEAGPPSATYRVRKYVRRNRVPLAAAAAIAMVLVAATALSMWQAHRAVEAESQMAAERQRALVAKGRAEGLLVDVQASQKLAENRRVEAENAKNLAEERGKQLAVALTKATDATNRERVTRREIEQRLREADAMRLAMNSKDSRQRYPQRALLLAAEAVETTRRKNEPIRSAAHQALREALANIGGRPMVGHHGIVVFAEVTPNGRWLITSDATAVRRWDLSQENPTESSVRIGSADLAHRAMAISPDGKWLATMAQVNQSRVFRLWDLEGEKFTQPVREMKIDTPQYVGEAAFSTDSRWFMTRTFGSAWLWDLSDPAANSKPKLLTSKNSPLNRVEVSAKGRWALTEDGSRNISLWNLVDDAGPEPRPLTAGYLEKVQLSPNGRWLAASDRSGYKPRTRVWDLIAEDPFQSAREVPVKRQQGPGLPICHFLFDGDSLAIAQEDTVAVWDLSANPWQAPSQTLSLYDTNDRPSPELAQEPARIRAMLSVRDNRLLTIDSSGVISRFDLQAKDPQGSRIVIGQDPLGGDADFQVSRSGRWLASTSPRNAPRLWDLWQRNRHSRGIELIGHDTSIYGGVQAAIGGGIWTRLVRDASPPRLPFQGSAGQFRAAIGMGERWLVTRGYDATPRLWDLKAENPARAGLRAGLIKIEGDGGHLAIRGDGHWVAASGPNIRVFDPNALEPMQQSIVVRPQTFLASLSGNDQPLSRDGRWFAMRIYQGRQNLVGIFDLTSEELVGRQPTPNNADAQKVPKAKSNTANEVEETAIWQSAVAAGRWLERFSNPFAGPRNTVLPGAHRPQKVVGDGATSRQRAAMEHEPVGAHFNAVFVGPRGHWLLSKHQTGWSLWNLDADGETSHGVDLAGDLRYPTFSPDGRWLAAYQTDGPRTRLALWDLALDEPRSFAHEFGQVSYLDEETLAFSGDSKWLASAAGGIRVWPLTESGLGEQQVLAAEKPNTQRIAISHDGHFIATAEGQTVSVWDRRGPGAPVGHVLRGHEQTVAKLAMSAEGSWLATASHDGEVKIWDLRDEELQDSTITLSAKQEGGQQAVFQELLFSPDGRWLGASTYHALYFWDLDPAGLLDEARRLAGRELSSDELARFRLNTPDRQRERLLRQAHEFTKQLGAKPTDVELLQRRADLLAAAGSFQEAIDDLRLISRLRPDDHWPQYNLLSLYAQTGQREAYRAECERLASQFGKTDQLEILERIAKGALFWAESGNDWNIVAARADRALEQAIENKHWVVAWAEIAKGLAEYRVGNYAAAVEWAQKGLSHGTANAYSIGVPGNQVRALALAQLGRLDEARSALAEARTVHASFPSPLAGWTSGWHDWYMAEIMFHEIDALLIEKLPPPMAATDVDLDGD